MTPVSGSALALLRAWLPADDDADRPRVQVCTVDADGRPDARTMLLSEWDAEGFVFHTDATSRKMMQLADRNGAALVVLWPGFSRQLTVQGEAEPVDGAALQRAYARRSPYLRQLAWQNTTELAQLESEERARQWAAFAATRAVDRLEAPEAWTGFRVRPTRLTFWQSDPAGPSHRVEYRRDGERWSAHHLAG